jgi:hypothetical protein
LRADLSEEPARWHLVAVLPLGKHEDELGLQLPPKHTPLPIFPFTFAIAPDGSIWMGDIFKRRAAHYSRDGRFLGAVTGITFNRFTPYLQDMAFAGKRLLIMLRDHHGLTARVMRVEHGRLTPRIKLQYRGKPLLVRHFVPTTGEPIGEVEGFAGRKRLASGPNGFARLDVPGSGNVEFLPGVPLADGSFLDVRLDRTTDRDLEARFTIGSDVAIRPIRIELWTGRGGRAGRLPAAFAIETAAPLPNGIAVYVEIGPVRAKDAHFGGGRWLLEVFDDGSPLVWERLPEPGLSDESTVRDITSTPDGTVYLMLPEPDAMYIYRR